jgi:hypothetical protein
MQRICVTPPSATSSFLPFWAVRFDTFRKNQKFARSAQFAQTHALEVTRLAPIAIP